MSITADEIIFSIYAKLDAVQPPVVRPLKLNQRIVSLQANKPRLIDLWARCLPGEVAFRNATEVKLTQGDIDFQRAQTLRD